MNFDQTCTDTFWEEEKSRLQFSDLDLIFKVTPALWKVKNRVYVNYLLNQWIDFGVYVNYLLNQWMDFDQTHIDTLL